MNWLSDSFNARHQRAIDVADCFVPTEDFDTIRKNRHAIILGPRGSGKTTLLKMLTQRAYKRWSEQRGETELLPFTSIYVPTDIHWHHQLLYAKELLVRAPRFYRCSSTAAVNTCVQLALVESFLELIEIDPSLKEDQEVQLCNLLISSWGLGATIPKLPFVHLELKRRIVDIGAGLNRVIEDQLFDENIPKQERWFYEDFLAITDHAVSAFDACFSRSGENKWALCFDELELAPTWLQERLFRLARSASQKIILKLSSSPNPETTETGQATPSEDFDLIKLWRSSMVKRRQFCEQLATRVLVRKGYIDVSPVSFLGESISSDIEVSEEEDSAPYSPGSEEWRAIKEVASWDESLRSLLIKKDIDPDDPQPKNQSQKDAVLRKIKPVVFLRAKFSKIVDGKIRRRGRRASVGYHGATAVFDLSDGNPRRLIRIFESLCDAARIESHEGTKKVSQISQRKVLLNVAYLFKNYLERIPGAHLQVTMNGVNITLYQLLREIGKYFSSQILVGPFPLDAKTTFVVDSAVGDDVVGLLKVASYHGAIVRVDQSETEFMTDLRGGRFRLCYTLAPIFPLPLRVMGEANLSNALENIFSRVAADPANTGKQRQVICEQLTLI